MNKFGFFTMALLLGIGCRAGAGNVIFMLADGMGDNHIMCAQKDRPLYLNHLAVHGYVRTRSASHEITDSAASATAHSCGQKTNNGYLAKLPDASVCRTIAEEAVEKGLTVGIYSTDYETGATPSAFYAHTRDRHLKDKIKKYKDEASQKMDIAVPVPVLSAEIKPRLNKLAESGQPFFALFEEAGTDTNSHANKLPEMKKSLYDFDLSVMKAVAFAAEHPKTTVIVLSDHETGGLTPDCRYTSTWHTGADISVYAFGHGAGLFNGVQDNTEIYTKMKYLLLND